MFPVHNSTGFMIERLRSVEVEIAICHNRKMIIVEIPAYAILSVITRKGLLIHLHIRITVVGLRSADKLISIPSVNVVFLCIVNIILPDWFLDKYIVVETGISVKNRHEPCHICSVRHMIWCIAVCRELLPTVVCSAAYPCK